MMQHRMKAHLMPNSDSRINTDNQHAPEISEDTLQSSDFEELNCQEICDADNRTDIEVPPVHEEALEDQFQEVGFECSVDSAEGRGDDLPPIKAEEKDSKIDKKGSKRGKGREGKRLRGTADSINSLSPKNGSTDIKNVENSNSVDNCPEDDSLIAASSSIKEDTVVKNKYKELLDPSFLVLPSYGKGRGRKKKDASDNAAKVSEEQENKPEIASKSRKTKRGISKMKNNPKMSVLKKQAKKRVFRKIKPLREGVKKLTKGMSKIVDNELALSRKSVTSPSHGLSKRNRKAKLNEGFKSEDKSETDSIFSDSDVPLKRKLDDKTNEDVHSTFENDHVLTVMKNVPSQSTSAYENSAKRKNKNSSNSDLIPNLNIPKGKKVKFNDDELSAFASSPIDSHNTISFSPDLSIVKEKSSSSKSLPSQNTGSVKVIKLKSETILSDVESVSPTKVPSTKGNKNKKTSNTIDGVDASTPQNRANISKSPKPAALLIDYYKIESSPPTSPINDKSLKGIKPIPRTICDIQSGPSTSTGGRRTVNFKVTTIVSDDESETDDASDFKQEPSRKKVCPICKKRFPGSLLRSRHVQLVHGRKNNRIELDSPQNESIKGEKMQTVQSGSPKNRSSQRQCIKPLPPMKRRYKKAPTLMHIKKRKL